MRAARAMCCKPSDSRSGEFIEKTDSNIHKHAEKQHAGPAAKAAEGGREGGREGEREREREREKLYCQST